MDASEWTARHPASVCSSLDNWKGKVARFGMENKEDLIVRLILRIRSSFLDIQLWSTSGKIQDILPDTNFLASKDTRHHELLKINEEVQ